ncbi:DNA repair protein RecO [Candidatus Phycorickettsia trachydisci]|uniref:DNA repair protein RecO n=1 Tax=Candidatus Phycorickettsia trachydisci TaxID=2115978 RepID=A0A2P1P9T9_9RICK|nr:hypothetical protein [Candidatus Phycorickettsia trachydisci]AVP88028.1 DNA repair protein RecO [Candidatus Phycorickettsia trachydisci]
MQEQIEFHNLIEAREKLSKVSKSTSLINAPGTIRSLGPIAIDYIFKTLKSEFHIEAETFRVDDDIAGLYYALSKGYKNIIYTGPSKQAKDLLRDTQT